MMRTGMRLPREHPTVASKKIRSEGSSSSEPALILLVDDYQDGREMYADALTFSGFRALEASSGLEALQLAIDRLPDLILMDLSLPGMDGWEVTQRLKKDARTKHIPIIALTAHALTEERERAEAAGCDGFLAKPCLPDELLAEVRRVLSTFNTAS
jgi:two-component system, cell cycle response regulator DivK